MGKRRKGADARQHLEKSVERTAEEPTFWKILQKRPS